MIYLLPEIGRYFGSGPIYKIDSLPDLQNLFNLLIGRLEKKLSL